MHRRLAIASSLVALACISSKPKVAPAPASSGAATCNEERAAAAVLYIVDGLPVTCTAAMSLPTDRIASVEVRKGAAAAEYGSAAATGVVIIQTKRGR